MSTIPVRIKRGALPAILASQPFLAGEPALLDFTSCGPIPYSVPELMAEVTP